MTMSNVHDFNVDMNKSCQYILIAANIALLHICVSASLPSHPHTASRGSYSCCFPNVHSTSVLADTHNNL